METEALDAPRDIETPFRVIDDGTAFRAETVVGVGVEENFRFPVRIFPFDVLVAIGPYYDPPEPPWDLIPGPMVELMLTTGQSEYIRADAEQVGRAWLNYRKRKRNPVLYYLSATLTTLIPMTTNENKRPSYLSQVFDSKLFSAVIIVVGLVLTYTGSLMLFADWSNYQDPWSVRGSNRFVFIAAAVILLVSFLVPLFKKSYRDARKGI